MIQEIKFLGHLLGLAVCDGCQDGSCPHYDSCSSLWPQYVPDCRAKMPRNSRDMVWISLQCKYTV